MWVPKSEQEIADRLDAGDLIETEVFDLKRELPRKGRNVDLAIDVAQMANDGGVLLYGVGRESEAAPIALHPLDDLAGQEERAAQIIAATIGGNLHALVRIRQIPTTADASTGYLVVQVPASPNAPHMVLPKKRFYGRVGTTTVELGQGEVDRLYERRKVWEVDHGRLLDEAYNRRPIELADGLAHLYVILRPLGSDEGLLDRALRAAVEKAGPGNGDPLYFLREAKDLVPNIVGEPTVLSLTHFVHVGRGRSATTALDSSSDLSKVKARRALQLAVDRDGGMYLFHGRAGERHRDAPAEGLMLFDVIVASQTAVALAFAGCILRAGEHYGPVDVGVAVHGIKGAYHWHFGPGPLPVPYDEPTYTKATRRPALDLIEELPSVLRALLDPLFQVIGQGRQDPIGQLFRAPVSP